MNKIYGNPDSLHFPSVGDAPTDAHVNGEYRYKNPTWHVEQSPRKSELLHRMIRKHNLYPMTVCDVGCGAGEALRQLQLRLDSACRCWG